MCGIWGVMSTDKNLHNSDKKAIIDKLFLLSESRGKESTGLACFNDDGIALFKDTIRAGQFIKSDQYKKFIEKYISDKEKLSVIGHVRLETNGSSFEAVNCHPIQKSQKAVVHDGIIVNESAVWEKHPEWSRETGPDSEIIINHLWYGSNNGSAIYESLNCCFQEIYGITSICGLDKENNTLFAATNNGSLYYYVTQNNKTVIFASERNIIEKLLSSVTAFKNEHTDSITQLLPYEICLCNAESNIKMEVKRLTKRESIPDWGCRMAQVAPNLQKYHRFDVDLDKIHNLKRCSKCLLPETMPFIEFDEQGVCNYCHNWIRPKSYGEDKLVEWTDNHKKKSNQKILATFSGGRDSSFSLHYLKKELDLDVIAYSYDWGVVTDLARRNQSRMCDKLGIEFIVVSADIRKKRDNIRKNINAWLKHPSLGMVPLFMAGDKQYFYYANEIAKENDIHTICLSTNRYEATHFKYGFCNIIPYIFRPGWEAGTEQLPASDVFKMAYYYSREFLCNPSYLNSSVLDTAWAAISNYGIKHEFLRPFDYVEWNENRVNEVLLGLYDWEKAPNINSTWRIGDGTAPFYNYIYYMMCGFTESDCLRSNQIRAGMITRDEGLNLIDDDNRIQYNEMKWYFDTVGLDMNDVLERVSSFKKLYE